MAMTPGEFDQVLRTAVAIVKDEDRAQKEAARAGRGRRK